VPEAEVVFLDTGQFALEKQADEIADLTRGLLDAELGGPPAA